MRKKIIILLLAFIIGGAALPARAQDGEELIEGGWHLSGTLPKSKSGGTAAWFLDWNFSSGDFLMTGYPPISQKGKYRIVKKDGDKLTLELYEQSGDFGTKDKQIEIVVDTKNDTLKIDGKEGFKRVKKKTS